MKFGYRKFVFIILFVIFHWVSSTAQLPCTNPPNGEGCLCSTAGILCTPDQLDGFTFSMSSTTNDGDLPDSQFNADLCPGIQDQDGFPNNVNFFAFIVWCENLTFDVLVTNCIDNPNDNLSSYGIQMAMFASCGSQNSGWNPVTCLTDGDDYCYDTAAEVPAVQTFSATGLTIGGTYYFMLDGCAKSTCDITIDVVGTCGTGVIDDWTTGLTGPTATCVGATDTYTAEDINGAVEFYYYLDGVLIASGEDLTSTNITWTNPGTYTLCVDVSNLPCIEETAFPPQNCITIDVIGIGDSEIDADPMMLCPDETSVITVTGNSTDPSLSGYIIIIGPDGNVYQVDQATSTSLTYDQCGDFTAYFYNFFTADNPTLPTIGSPWTLPDCVANCCDLSSVNISFEDTELPVFGPTPVNESYACANDVPIIEDITFTDNCIGDGIAIGEETGTYTLCDGGTIFRKWTAMDSCENSVTYTQEITITGMPEATFETMPANENIACGMLDTNYPSLTASNGGVGDCNIDVDVPPMVTEDIDNCDGTVTLVWTYTDICNRTITHTQVLTILPPDTPQFIDPPSDMEVDCDAIPTDFPDLGYTNNLSGSCEITGNVPAEVTSDVDECGGSISITWEFVDPCANILLHTQVITVSPPPVPTLDQMPGDINVNCGDAIPDPAELVVSNGLTGLCGVNQTLVATVTDNTDACDGDIIYVWDFMDDCGNVINHTQTITLLPPDEAAFINPPVDESVSCDAIPSSGVDLDYTNGMTGMCAITGTVAPTVIDNSSECGGTIEYMWEYTDACNRTISHTQTYTVNPAATPTFTDLPSDVTVNCGDPAVVPSPLTYANNETGICEIMGTVDPIQEGEFTVCGGDVIFTWEVAYCSNTISHTQTIVVNPAAAAAFIDPPTDILVSCSDFDPTPPSLAYSNMGVGNCEISGEVEGVFLGTPGPCGDDVQYFWSFTDECGRTIEHTQIVAIEPASPPMFLNLPPENITYACEDVPLSIPALSYSNGETGPCAISGSVPGFQLGTYDECGGNITYTWTLTDLCGYLLTYTQFVEILPANEPVWVNPPADVILQCGEALPEAILLQYSNSLLGGCLISGFDDPTIIEGPIVTEFIWEYTNPCSGNTISHIQTITGVSTPDIEISPIDVSMCFGDAFDLSSIMVIDNNGQSLTLQYFGSNGLPLSSPVVQPSETTTYTLIATNEDGCTDEGQFTVMVDFPPSAGGDGSTDVCANFGSYNLFQYLIPPFDFDGTWFDNDGSGANIDNPFSATFNGVLPGIYNFDYVVLSGNTCPDETSTLTINVTNSVIFDILNVECDASASTYTVTVLSYGNDILSSEGVVNVIDADTVLITDIPISSLVVVSGLDVVSFCITDVFVNPPDCDCPTVAPPISNGNPKICEGDTIPTLSVMVDPGFTANWYSTQSGGSPIATMSLTYIPTVSLPGIYTYYVDAEDINGCLSNTRIPVIFEILNKPIVNDVELHACEDSNGESIFDLLSIIAQINPNASFDISFFNSLADAIANINELSTTFETSQVTTNLVSKVVSTFGCIEYGNVLLISDKLPTVDIEVQSESCSGLNDGMLSVSNISPMGSIVTFSASDYTDNFDVSNLSPGAYSIESVSPQGCISSEDVTIDEGHIIEMSNIIITCFSNGTVSDASDDYYTVIFTLSTNDTSPGQLSIVVNGGSASVYNYGEIEITLPADGNTAIFLVTDLESGCNLMYTTDQLISCSTDCLITVDPLDLICNDNGTPSDNSDDFYVIIFNANAINGASNNKYAVLVNGTPLGVFDYGIGGQLQLPADGNQVMFSFLDNEDPQCFANIVSEALIPCSNDCIIDLMTNIECNNNNTIGVPEDDFYTLTFSAVGSNVSDVYNLALDGMVIDVYMYSLEYELIIPADGIIHEFIISDGVDADCQAMYTTIPLIDCSGMCEIEVEFDNVVCDNLNTSNDILDDVFTADVTINIDEGSGMWSINELGITGTEQTFTVGPFDIVDGDVTLTLSDALIESCSIVITIPAPEACSICEETVDAGPDYELDCVIKEVTLMGSASSNGIASWVGPTGIPVNGFAITTPLAGTYYFMVDYGQGCIVVDSAEVTISDEIPMANAGPNQAITCLVDTVILLGNVSGGSGNYTYAWYDVMDNLLGTDLALIVTNPGNYFFVVSDLDTACDSPPDVVMVEDNTQEPSSIIYANPGSILDCVIEVIYITNENESNVLYSWFVNNQPIANEEIVITDPATIQLISIDTISGCESSSTLDIPSLQEYPIINLISDGAIDCQDTEVTLDASNSQQGTNITSTWYDDSGATIATNTFQIDVNTPGIYFLELMDTNNGCINRDTIEVIDNSEYPVVTGNDNYGLGCLDEAISIQVSVDNSELYSYAWSTIDGSISGSSDIQSITVLAEGVYIVTVINEENNCVTLDTIVVLPPNVLDGAVFTIKDESCPDIKDGTITISNPVNGESPFTYFVNGVEVNNQVISGLDAGQYEIQIIDAEGCELTQMVTIQELEDFEIDLPLVVSATIGDDIFLNAIPSIPVIEVQSVRWSPSIGLECDTCLVTKVDLELASEIYTVTVVDIYGCEAEAVVRLDIKDKVVVTIPNTFSPDGDGNNDNFTIYTNNENITVSKLHIFDRWGELIFVQENFPPNNLSYGWDGKFKESYVVQGVYVYMFEVIDLEGKTIIYSGDVTVLN